MLVQQTTRLSQSYVALSAVIISLTLCFTPCIRSAIAERASIATWQLHQASVQLEVTILSSKMTDLGQGEYNVLHRARVDRVLHGDRFQEGEEVMVVSKRIVVPMGTVGSSGHRSTFQGVNGLPMVGDRARLFAEGKAKLLVPAPPNGWKQIEPNVAFIAVGCDDTSKAAVQALALPLEQEGSLHASFYDPFVLKARSSPPITPSWRRLNYRTPRNIDFSVLWVKADLTLDGIDNVFSSFFHGQSIAALGETILHVSTSPVLDREDSQSKRHYVQEEPLSSHDVFGVVSVHDNATGTIRLLSPEESNADNDVFSGSNMDNILIHQVPCIVEELTSDCQVLLYGLLQEGDATPKRVPVLWRRELAPAVMNQFNSIPEHALPPQRVMATILTPSDAIKHPAIAKLLQNTIAWTGNCAGEKPELLSKIGH